MRPAREHLSENSLILQGIPKKFHSVSLEDFQTQSNQSLEEVKKFVAGYLVSLAIYDTLTNFKGIYFYGSNGVGKTMLSSIILREAYRRRWTVRRTTFLDYMEQYTKHWSTFGAVDKEVAQQDFYQYYKAVDFLVLEEVGKEVDSKISAPILEDCLRYREEQGLVTFMCTNIPPKVLEQRYGASVISLMTGSMTPIKMEFDDKRGK